MHVAGLVSMLVLNTASVLDVYVPFENWLRVYFICLNRFHFYLIIHCDFG